MSDTEIFVLSAALGMDLFSVAVPIGMQRVRLTAIFKASCVFALLHIVMLLSGYYLGDVCGAAVEWLESCASASALLVEDVASLLGAGVLVALGLWSLKESLGESGQAREYGAEMLRGWSLWMLAFGVSVDAMAVGLGLGMLEVDLVRFNAILGAVIFSIAAIGLSLGRKAGAWLGERAAQCGGVLLVGFGLHILWSFLQK